GEPAYRWVVRFVRYRRGPTVWRAELMEAELQAADEAGLRAADKPEISGPAETAAERFQEPEMPDRTDAPAAEEREVSPALPAPSAGPPRLRLVRSEPAERPDGEA